jgi:hypothetical protein
MGRKKSEEKKPMEAVASETKFVRLELPLELHRQLRMEAASQDKSMAELARNIVEEYLKARRGAKR